MFNFEKVMGIFSQITELESKEEMLALIGMIADFAAARFDDDSQEILKQLIKINKEVNNECGLMMI